MKVDKPMKLKRPDKIHKTETILYFWVLPPHSFKKYGTLSIMKLLKLTRKDMIKQTTAVVELLFEKSLACKPPKFPSVLPITMPKTKGKTGLPIGLHHWTPSKAEKHKMKPKYEKM